MGGVRGRDAHPTADGASGNDWVYEPNWRTRAQERTYDLGSKAIVFNLGRDFLIVRKQGFSPA